MNMDPTEDPSKPKEPTIQDKHNYLFNTPIGAEVLEDMLSRFGLFRKLDHSSPDFLYDVACHNLAVDLLTTASVLVDRKSIIRAMLGRGPIAS